MILNSPTCLCGRGLDLTVIFGTLGFTPNKLLPTVRNHPEAHELVFFHDHAPKGKEAAARVVEFCKERGMKATDVTVNAFDIIECAREMKREVRKHKPGEIVFNLTGGTPVISSAATLVCILEGLRAVYIHEETKVETSLPLLAVRYDAILNDAQVRVLRHVAIAGTIGCSQTEIVDALGIGASTVSHHVRRLKKQNLLRVEEDEDDSRSDRIFVMPSATLLLEDAA